MSCASALHRRPVLHRGRSWGGHRCHGALDDRKIATVTLFEVSIEIIERALDDHELTHPAQVGRLRPR